MKRYIPYLGWAAALLAVAAPILATIPNTFTPGTTISSAEVNENFEALEATRFSDGSAGDFTVTTGMTVNWRNSPPTDNNLQFANFHIEPNATLIVPSGTVIRCRNSFVNEGLIQVRRHTLNGSVIGNPLQLDNLRIRPAHPGIGPVAAGTPNVGTSGPQPGGSGGRGINNAFSAAQVLQPGVIGGGSASGFIAGLSALTDHDGGGTLTVLAEKQIRNPGNIDANGRQGNTGFGGGGGGVVILASRIEVDNSQGSVFAIGGSGGQSGTQNGPGGGGGGGIIHFIAPSILGAANTSVAGGSAGSVNGMVTMTPYAGGGGGGGGAGDGGSGSNASLNSTPAAAIGGDSGFVIETTADPVSLF